MICHSAVSAPAPTRLVGDVRGWLLTIATLPQSNVPRPTQPSQLRPLACPWRLSAAFSSSTGTVRPLLTHCRLCAARVWLATAHFVSRVLCPHHYAGASHNSWRSLTRRAHPLTAKVRSVHSCLARLQCAFTQSWCTICRRLRRVPVFLLARVGRLRRGSRLFCKRTSRTFRGDGPRHALSFCRYLTRKRRGPIMFSGTQKMDFCRSSWIWPDAAPV